MPDLHHLQLVRVLLSSSRVDAAQNRLLWRLSRAPSTYYFCACSDLNPQQTLDKAHNQHLPLIQRLRTKSLQGISRDNKVSLHVILLGFGGTIYNQYTITPLLSKPGHPSAQSAPTCYCTTLPCIKLLKQDHKNKTHNTIQQRQ